jgi:hypothetical protein
VRLKDFAEETKHDYRIYQERQMSRIKMTLMVALSCMLLSSIGMATSIKMKLSGPGRVNDSTIKAGQKVGFDIYVTNDTTHLGLSAGFKFTSPDNSIKMIVHSVDSGKGMDGSKGDVIGFNGFGDRSMFDLVNQVVLSDWDGKLPDLMGFFTCGFKKNWPPMPETKAYTIEMIVPTPGILKVDSAFYPPGGSWIVTTMKTALPSTPSWGGPYKFKVVK